MLFGLFSKKYLIYQCDLYYLPAFALYYLIILFYYSSNNIKIRYVLPILLERGMNVQNIFINAIAIRIINENACITLKAFTLFPMKFVGSSTDVTALMNTSLSPAPTLEGVFHEASLSATI